MHTGKVYRALFPRRAFPFAQRVNDFCRNKRIAVAQPRNRPRAVRLQRAFDDDLFLTVKLTGFFVKHRLARQHGKFHSEHSTRRRCRLFIIDRPVRAIGNPVDNAFGDGKRKICGKGITEPRYAVLRPRAVRHRIEPRVDDAHQLAARVEEPASRIAVIDRRVGADLRQHNGRSAVGGGSVDLFAPDRNDAARNAQPFAERIADGKYAFPNRHRIGIRRNRRARNTRIAF